MPHVLVAGTLHPAGHEILASAPGVTVEFAEGISEESYAPRLHAADALLLRTQPLGASTIAGAPRLRIVSRHGVGFDAVDVDALTARGVVLAVCGDVNSTSVAEHAMMLMLAATKRALRADGAVRRGAWGWREALEAQDLRGRNLLLVGFGRIGRRIAAMAAGFGLSVRAHDPLLLERGWPEGEVGPVAELREGLAWADVVSLSAPGTGRPLIGAAELAAMRPGAVLVNTARGGLIDEAALVDALRSGTVGGRGPRRVRERAPAAGPSAGRLRPSDPVAARRGPDGRRGRAHGDGLGAQHPRLLRRTARPRARREREAPRWRASSLS